MQRAGDRCGALQARVFGETQIFPRRQQRRQREHDQDDANHIAIDIVHTDCGNPQVSLGRQKIFVVEHERRAEIVDGADES